MSVARDLWNRRVLSRGAADLDLVPDLAGYKVWIRSTGFITM